MKTDTQIQRDVIDEIRWDSATRDAEIGVASRDGVITLTGQVSNYARKLAAVHAAERVAGVAAVADELSVKLPADQRRSDTDIAHQVVEALRWDVEVPDDKVKARVDDGWVTLEGQVEMQYERVATERAVRFLTGVRGVSNLITVMPKKVSTFEVSEKIKDALRRHAEEDANRIMVEAADGKVTLKGRVRSWSERQAAEHAAWSAPGVSSVNDELRIGV